jgi:tRNA acetyltransferase TAN1
LNLLITCGRNFESEAENEIKKILNECDDQEPKIHKTNMRGILFIDTNTDTTEIIDWVKKKITEEPWFVRYCLRMIPIQLESDTDIEKIKQSVQKLKNIIQKNDSYRITIEKRNSNIHSNEIIANIASEFSNKVSLDKPDWVVLIEIFGNKTGLSILRNDGIFSLEKSKRESE